MDFTSQVENRILEGGPVEVIQGLMQDPWVDPSMTMQEYMQTVSDRTSGKVRTSSPSDFVKDLIELGILFKREDGVYVLKT